MRPPRRLLVILAVITAASAATLGWVGWEMLRQDEAAEAQRLQERLNARADKVAQSLERLLNDEEERLSEWAVAPSPPTEGGPTAGLAVVFTATTVQPVGASRRLLFHPVQPARAEPPPDLFFEGEAAEYSTQHRGRAATIYCRLAETTDPATRAAALMRLGRVLRKDGRVEAALTAYGEMAAMADVPVFGLPADLIARGAEARLLAELDRPDAARRRAQALARDLAGGRWTLARGQFEHYAEEAARLGGTVTAAIDDIAMAEATADLWTAWRVQLPPRGRRLVRAHGTPLVMVWRGTPERLAAWIVQPDALLARIGTDAAFAVTLSDADGLVVAGAASESHGRPVSRSLADTRLPWTMSVSATGSPTGSATVTRGQLVVVGLGVMLIFLVAGSYFIGRAVKQEMDLARLQSDFVSTVSHEFRTPLAAMRQLSELLAAGRVPLEERRQQYYESLAGESRRLQRLVENLLNFGRLEAGARPYQLEFLDPRALVEQVVAEFRSQLSSPECQIEVSSESADAAVWVMADPQAVALALHNLIDNAVKYGGSGCLVSVSWTQHGSRVALRVSDRGPGIAAEEQSRIFQRFVRGTAAAAANVRGTGIGLAMVQQVAAGHGGEVTVESAPGVGSVFTMWLPVATRA